MNETFVHIGVGLICVVAHSLMKFNALNNKAVSANATFSFKDYLALDKVPIMLSFLSIILLWLVFDEISGKYEIVGKYPSLAFGGMGFTGSYIIQYIGSVAEKKITGIIDTKTNKADGVNYPITSVKDAPKPKP